MAHRFRTPKFRSEFVPMPTPDDRRFICTADDCREPATSGCLNCGVGRCVAHPYEPHEFPCLAPEKLETPHAK